MEKPRRPSAVAPRTRRRSEPGAGARRSAAVRTNGRATGSKRVFSFGEGQAEGSREMVELLGGKGANVAEMCRLGLPVPPGFTISTEVCTWFYQHGGAYPAGLRKEVDRALAQVERQMGRRFGDPADPLLVSVRSGSRASMPGMMDTVLNLGLNDRTVEGLAARTGKPRFAWDAYRRFLQMYSDVVLRVHGSAGAPSPMLEALERLKRERGVEEDAQLEVGDLRQLCAELKEIVRAATGEDFPQDVHAQLWGAIGAVFGSWMNERAIAYRSMNDIPSDWGTAVSVMAMVFGNLGESSGTGVAFTRDPATGEKRFYGEYLMNAQGEDVVAGLRTPLSIESLAATSPRAWRDLQRHQKLLERHYRDMQDLEFTIEEGKLYMLQCRAGKRTGWAAVRIAVDMVRERLITREEALLRIEPSALEQLLQPVFDLEELQAARKAGRLLTRGLNAGPGAASGRIVFSAAAAQAWVEGKEGPVILVRTETSPEDIRGMKAAAGILTARGGMTSHAALVARQMGKVCIVGAGALEIDLGAKRLRVAGRELAEGDWLSLDGSTGEVLSGRLATRPSEVLEALLHDVEELPGSNGRAHSNGRASTNGRHPRGSPVEAFAKVMAWADAVRTLGVRANADQPDQCRTAVAMGAEGVGLCRTEHMFFDGEKIDAVREMILADDAAGRERALAKLLPLQRRDFEGIFEAMAPRPVTIRSLDPPLHEFLPHGEEAVAALARKIGVSEQHLAAKVESLSEANPMLGHRGCRLGISFPEITAMQARAIFEAACEVQARTRRTVLPEIMIPLVATAAELRLQAAVVREVAERVFAERRMRVPYLVGTMIELPRAALCAGGIAEEAEFFSFGTNDLTQTTFGISRDDGARFLPHYLEREILPWDPFASIDLEGVGELMKIAVERGRAARPDLKLGICGEHGGDARSVAFCHALGLDYVSCSPMRLPLARLAAAQAALRQA